MRRLLWAGLLLALAACKSREPPATDRYYVADMVHLAVPRLTGWVKDTSLPPVDSTRGGILLRLVRESAVAGSPRVSVELEASHLGATALNDYLTRNLQEMGAMEKAGNIHIDTVEQTRLDIGNHPAYRVHHEYTVGTGPAQVAINQVSTYLVIDGRGVAVTAAGRTELYHPLAESVQAMIDGLRVLGDSDTLEPSPTTAPVDLGKVGGSKR